MNSPLILANLSVFHELFDEFRAQLKLGAGGKHVDPLTEEIRLQYDFIELTLTSSYGDTPALKATFEWKEGRLTLHEFQLASATDTAAIEEWISASQAVRNFKWTGDGCDLMFRNETITRYLNIADRIAQRTVGCAAGDHYRPGYYSKMEIGADQIVLSQVNHMNARSRDHKNDYSLRQLIFTIPLTSAVATGEIELDQIGEMSVFFSDRSSKNNKSCGAAILEQIQLERSLFHQTKHDG